MNNDLRAFFRGDYDSYKSYRADAEILWEGKHYVLIRTGVSYRKSRYVYMVDAHGLRYDEDAHPLVQLAAGRHPAQAERAKDHRVLLHESNQESGKGVFTGRWSQSKLAKCIEYAEAADATYEDDLAGWIEEYEEQKIEASLLAKQGRQCAARAAVFARRAAHHVGAKVTKDDKWESGRFAIRVLHLNFGSFGFYLDEDDWTFSVHTRSSATLTEKQLKRLHTLLCKFHAENERDELFEEEEEENDDDRRP
jgi:hypothetical protein